MIPYWLYDTIRAVYDMDPTGMAVRCRGLAVHFGEDEQNISIVTPPVHDPFGGLANLFQGFDMGKLTTLAILGVAAILVVKLVPSRS